MIAKDQPTIFDPTQVGVVLSSRQDGNMRPEWGPLKETAQHIAALAGLLSVNAESVVVMNVSEHPDVWDEIADVTSAQGRGVKDPEERVAADAVVTRLKNLALFLPVADCNAVAIHDSVQHVIALVHLGWKSTVANLAAKVVQHLIEVYHSDPTKLRIYFSPAIKQASYIFNQVEQADNPAWKPFLQKTKQGTAVDLPGFNRQRFIDAGVLPKNIEVSAINTATSKEYFSHYRSVRGGEPEGRFGLMILLK